jgi:hypothetical protein
LLASAAQDPAVQQVLARRADLPTRHMRAVVDQASKDMTALMENRIRDVGDAPVAIDMDTVGMRTVPAAMMRVASLAVEAGGLSEAVVAGFARAGQRLELVCALATLTRLPLPIVERALDAERPGAVVLMARALNFTFNTVRLILRLRPQGLPARGDLEMFQKEFEDMSPAKAWSAIGFMAARKDGRDGVAAA